MRDITICQQILLAQIEELKEENRELRAELYDARERILDLEFARIGDR